LSSFYSLVARMPHKNQKTFDCRDIMPPYSMIYDFSYEQLSIIWLRLGFGGAALKSEISIADFLKIPVEKVYNALAKFDRAIRELGVEPLSKNVDGE